MEQAIQQFLAFVEGHHQKHMQAQDLDPFAYDPEHTEHLEQFDGDYDRASGRVVLCTEVKGLRYEDRSRHLEKVTVGDAIELRRDPENIYNANNFELYTMDGMTVGPLSATLCNVLAPLYDAGIVQVESVTASYIEQFEARSRYVKQGVLFVRLTLHLTADMAPALPDDAKADATAHAPSAAQTLHYERTDTMNVAFEEKRTDVNEPDTETEILALVQALVNSYQAAESAYLRFIHDDAPQAEDVISVLDRTRLLHRLIERSEEIIAQNSIVPTEAPPLTSTAALTDAIERLSSRIAAGIQETQRLFNSSLDIDDEEEYQRVQHEARSRRKKYRAYETILQSYHEVIESYETIGSCPTAPVGIAAAPDRTVPALQNTAPLFTDTAFQEWLIRDGGVTEPTAQRYSTAIHNMEKIYQTQFGERVELLGQVDTDAAAAMVDALTKTTAYVEANERRHDLFHAALGKYAQFTGIPLDLHDATAARAQVSRPAPTLTNEDIVDLDTPQRYTHSKPLSLLMDGTAYTVNDWSGLYKTFLVQLYTDAAWKDRLDALRGKKLYGTTLDFTEKIYARALRRPIAVSTDFYAEGNLSTSDVIRHISALMEICGIGRERITITCRMRDADSLDGTAPETVVPDVPAPSLPDDEATVPVTVPTVDDTPSAPQETAEETASPESRFALEDAVAEMTDPPEDRFAIQDVAIETEPPEDIFALDDAAAVTQSPEDLFALDDAVTETQSPEDLFALGDAVTETQSPEDLFALDDAAAEMAAPHSMDPASPPASQDSAGKNEQQFAPDLSKPFDLRSAVIEIMSSDAQEITAQKGYHGGITPKSILGILHSAYGRTVGTFDLGKLLMIDDAFLSVGKGGYTLSPTVKQRLVQDPVPDAPPVSAAAASPAPDDRQIILKLDGQIVRAQDYQDALKKVCEAAITMKPFQMAVIPEKGLMLDGRPMFRRGMEDGYLTLSNSVQCITVSTMDGLQHITNAVKAYCAIQDDQISLISK